MIDDHSLFSKCLKEYLMKQGNIDVDIEARDPANLPNKSKLASIDIVLLDLYMPKLNGDEVMKMIKRDHPHIKIIILSMCTDLQIISNLIDSGIHSYVSKADDPEDLIKAINSVYQNKIYRNKLFTDALYWNNYKHSKVNADKPVIEFSDREKKILQLLWEEKSNKEISNELFLGVRSIEKIRQDMKERLGVKTTIGLLKYALNNKIIDFTEVSQLV